MGSNNVWIQVFFVTDDEPSTFRAILGHSIIDADPSLMCLGSIDHYDSPRLYHGARFCNIANSQEGLLPGKRTDSGRSNIFFSAAMETK